MPNDISGNPVLASTKAKGECTACGDQLTRHPMEGVEIRVHPTGLVDGQTAVRTNTGYPERLTRHRVAQSVLADMRDSSTSTLGEDRQITSGSMVKGVHPLPISAASGRALASSLERVRSTGKQYLLGDTRIIGGPLDGLPMHSLGYSSSRGPESELLTEKGQYEDREEDDRFRRESHPSIPAALERAKESHPKAKDVGEVDNEFETVTGECGDEFVGRSKTYTTIPYYLHTVFQPVSSEPTDFNLRHAAKVAGEVAYGEAGKRISFDDVAKTIKLLFDKREGEVPVSPPAHAESALKKAAEDTILNNMFFTRFKCEAEDDCMPVFELLGWQLVKVTQVAKSESLQNEVPTMPGSFSYKVEKNGVWYIVSGVRFDLEMEWEFVFRVVCEGAKEEAF